MCKVNLAYLYGTAYLEFHFYMLVHVWCHAILHVENPVCSLANINLHVIGQGHLATWNSLHGAKLNRGSILYNPQERLLT